MTKCYDCEFFVFTNNAPYEHFEKLSEDTNQELI